MFIRGTMLDKFPATTNWGAVISFPTKQELLFSLLLSLVILKTQKSSAERIQYLLFPTFPACQPFQYTPSSHSALCLVRIRAFL